MLERVQQPPREEAEGSADRLQLDDRKAGAMEQIFEPVPGVAVKVMRRLMYFPFLRNDKEQVTAGFEDAADLREYTDRLLDMLERNDVDAGMEGSVREGKRGEVGYDVQAAVVPRGVADSEIDCCIALAREEARMHSFSGSGVQNP